MLLGLLPHAGLALSPVPGPAQPIWDLPDRPALQVGHSRTASSLDPIERWTVLWDPWTGVAAEGRRGMAAAAQAGRVTADGAMSAAEDFSRRHAQMLGAAGVDLRHVRCQHLGRAWCVTWQQQLAGHDVVGARLDLVLTESGRVAAFQSSLVPGLSVPTAHMAPQAALGSCAAALGKEPTLLGAAPVVVVLPLDGRYEARAALRLELLHGQAERWEALVEAPSGRLLALERTTRYARFEGTTSAEVLPLYAQDAPESRLIPWLHVWLRQAPRDFFSAVSDALGRFTIEDAPPGSSYVLHAGLLGLYLSVSNEAGDPPANFTRGGIAVPGAAEVHFGSGEARLDERTIYAHANVIHDYAKSRFDFADMDFALPARAAVRNPANGDPDYANAFWDGSSINFGNGGGTFHNLGLFADVIYHEYAHGITDYMYRPGGGLRGPEGAAIHEALSDYFACTLTGEPLVGEFLQDGPGFYLRNLENTLQWPADRRGEEHADGEILGGALWDVRELVGPEVADAVIHFARALFPQTFTDYVQAMLVQDDMLFGDGAPGNGSPHEVEILAGFAAHGMGPGVSPERRIAHLPLRDTEDAGAPRTVRARFDLGVPAPADTMRLYWSTGGQFVCQRMRRELGGFVGEIPPQPEGTAVRYYLAVPARRGAPAVSDPPGAPQEAHSYRVGPDLEPPLVEHVPRTSAAAFGWPASIHARIDDNLGVAYAYVEYLQNGAPGPILGLVPSSDDRTRWTTQFPNVGVLGDVIEYWLVAVDASQAGNASRLPESGGLSFEITSQLAESFESGGPWSHRSVLLARPDPWHPSTAFNHTPGGSTAWLCGAEVGEYPTRVAAELVTDLYDLGRGARARVWSQIDAETNGPLEAFDAGVVQLQLEGETAWQPLAPAGGYTHRMADTGGTSFLPPSTPCLSGHDADWRELEFDLSAWSRQRVRLRFLFASDNVPTPTGDLRGWALDDFRLDPGARDPSDVAGTPAPAGRLLASPPGPSPGRAFAFDLRVPAGAGPLRLEVFDAAGRRVRTLADWALPAGARRIVWDGRRENGLAAASGVYWYRLRSRHGEERGKLIVLR